MVGFELGKESEKDVFRLFTSLGQRKGYLFFAFLTQTFILQHRILLLVQI